MNFLGYFGERGVEVRERMSPRSEADAAERNGSRKEDALDRAGGAGLYENQCATVLAPRSSAQSIAHTTTTLPPFVQGEPSLRLAEGLVGVRVDGRFQSVVIEAIGVDRGRRARLGGSPTRRPCEVRVRVSIFEKKKERKTRGGA